MNVVSIDSLNFKSVCVAASSHDWGLHVKYTHIIHDVKVKGAQGKLRRKTSLLS